MPLKRSRIYWDTLLELLGPFTMAALCCGCLGGPETGAVGVVTAVGEHEVKVVTECGVVEGAGSYYEVCDYDYEMRTFVTVQPGGIDAGPAELRLDSCDSLGTPPAIGSRVDMECRWGGGDMLWWANWGWECRCD